MARRITYADDDTESVRFLLGLRIPSLVFGLVLGLLLSFVVSRFEEVLSKNFALVFFLPLVVYMAAAVGAQTDMIYTRDLRSGKANFWTYLFKESAIGLSLGVLSGAVAAVLVWCLFQSVPLATAVGLGMAAAVTVAPIIALIVSELLQMDHKDPAVGAGPISTVIQDTASVLLYGLIATVILL